jgi:hypothetical protein
LDKLSLEIATTNVDLDLVGSGMNMGSIETTRTDELCRRKCGGKVSTLCGLLVINNSQTYAHANSPVRRHQRWEGGWTNDDDKSYNAYSFVAQSRSSVPRIEYSPSSPCAE